jgi:hypothetical protein
MCMHMLVYVLSCAPASPARLKQLIVACEGWPAKAGSSCPAKAYPQRSYSRMGSYDDRIVNCQWCGIQGQVLHHPSPAYLTSLIDVDPHGPLCDRCYETLDRPPRFRYANMLFLHLVGPDQAARIAEYAYESCATFAGWRALSIRLNLQRQHGHERRPAPLQHIPIRHHGDGVDH